MPNKTKPFSWFVNFFYPLLKVLAYLNPTQIAALGFNITPIHFNLNKSNIRKDADAILKTNLEVLSKHPELSILIYGFADSRGKEEYNLPLSEKRANKVKQFLISKGLNASQIEQVNGKGEEHLMIDKISAKLKILQTI